MHIGFSSFGPTIDLRTKPNVCAYGKALVAKGNKMKVGYGTSFAAPLITGFAACVWQLNPAWDAATVFSEIEKSANLYPYYDYAHGYGIPTAQYFINSLPRHDTCFYFLAGRNAVHVMVDSIAAQENAYLYYHLRKNNGVLSKYAVIKVSSTNPITLHADSLANRTLQVSFKNVALTYKPINK